MSAVERFKSVSNSPNEGHPASLRVNHLDPVISTTSTKANAVGLSKITEMRMSPIGSRSSLLLKTKAVVVSVLKVVAETIKSLGRILGLVIGAILAPVNATLAGANLYDLAKNHSTKTGEQIAAQSGMIAGNLALLLSGITLIKTYFATSSLMGMMKSAAMKFAKIAGAVGLFILAAVHIGKVIVDLVRLKNASPEERKELIIKIIHNLLSGAGLIILGVVMLGAVAASAISPFGWIAMGLILIGVGMEAIHKNSKANAQQKSKELPAVAALEQPLPASLKV